MADKKIYLTQEGLAELQEELRELTEKKRPETLARLSEARDQGDLSENAEYTAAHEDLSFLDGRIGELEELIKQATVISGQNGNTKTVDLGSTVTVKVGDKKEEFTVVGEFEADPTKKKVSNASPFGQALIGRGIGDNFEVDAPAGKIKYTIISIR